MTFSRFSRHECLRSTLCLVVFTLVAVFTSTAVAQLDEHCTVAVLNRTVQVKPDGTWVLPNIPANFGQVRARATCVENGITRSGESALFSIPANGSANVPRIQLDAATPIPSSLSLSAPRTTLTTAGETVQVTVTARFPDGSTQNVSAGSTGTSYVISNPAVATISPNGLVTAVSSGTVIISALHEGALGLLRLQATLAGGDSDGDGIPDDIETANGLNPNDLTDGFADLDSDGLTNKQELIDYGTNLNLTDTDGDGLSDGAEVRQYGTNPLLTDTDGDGTDDGREVQCGSDPKNATDRGRKLISISVTPPVFTINANTILLSEAYWQLAVTGTLANNCGTVNLTSIAQGTNYTSSNLTTCNFGAEGGRVFAGADGTCAITATNSGFSATANGTVMTFAPTALTSLNIPGTTNNVDVSGDFAYVAAGAAGLQIVNVADRSAPMLAGSFDTPGNAQDVQVIGNLAYVADGASGLRIIDVTNPNAPVSRGALDTPGDAQDVVVNGSRAFVADGANGLQIVDVTNPATPSVLGFVDTAGTASGVDVDPQQNLAVVADGTSGIRVIDITDVAHPAIIGSVDTGTANDVAVRDGFAFVADGQSSLTVVDLSTPQTPAVRASTPASTGGLLNDLALTGRFALGAATFRPTNVPIIDVSTPPAPQPRALLNFSAFSSDVGTGIAVDSNFVYLTTDRSRLLIGQYLGIEDRAGIPPTVRIASPASGETVIERSSLPISVDASDDVAVVAVSLLVNGNVVATDTAPPYQFNFTVPAGISTLTFGATAYDLGGNEGTAEEVTVNVIPDPKTTVTGRVVDHDGNPLAGATVICLGVSGTTDADGKFSLADVSTIRGPIVCSISVTIDGVHYAGRVSASFVRGGTTIVGPVVATPFSPFPGLYPGELFSVGTTDPATSVALGDLNGDGRLDVVTANNGYHYPALYTVSVLLGQGDGTLGSARTFDVGATDPPTSVALGDMNGDGRVDVVTANRRNVSVLLGNGDGTLGSARQFGVGADPRSVALGDVNGDGRLDVVTANLGASATVSVLLGNGDGTFGSARQFGVGADPPTSVALGDLNGDGRLDVVTANYNYFTLSTVSVLLGQGDGMLGSAQTFGIGVTHARPESVALGDVNGDGRLDVVTANNGSFTVAVLLGNGDGTLGSAQHFGVGPYPASVALGDMNGDGRLDVVTANVYAGGLNNGAVLLGNGDGTLGSARFFGTWESLSVALGDMNNDGRLDVVTAVGSVSVLLGQGDGTLEDVQTFHVEGHPYSVALGDINGDGRLDVVATAGFSDAVSVLLGQGDGTLGSVRIFHNSYSYRVSVALGDINGDGRLDVVTANSSSNTVSVLLGNGDGTLGSAQIFGVGGTSPYSVALGDVNEDGWLDVVTANSSSNTVSVLLGNGNGTLGSARVFVVEAYQPTSVAVGDVNGDGWLDVVTANYATVSVLLGQGDGTLESERMFGVGRNPYSVALGDLNGDGRLDVVTANSGSTTVAVLLHE